MENKKKKISSTKSTNKNLDNTNNMSKQNIKPRASNSNNNMTNQKKNIKKQNNLNNQNIKNNSSNTSKKNTNKNSANANLSNKNLSNDKLQKNNPKKIQNKKTTIEKTNVNSVKKITNENIAKKQNSNNNSNKGKKQNPPKNINSNNKQSNLNKNVSSKNNVNKAKKNISNNPQKNISESKTQNSSEKKVTENPKKDNSKEEKTKSKFIIFIILGILVIVLVIFSIFYIHFRGNKIASNVYIENINISNLQITEAKEKIENEYKKVLKDEFTYLYKEQEYTIKLEDIGFSILVDEAVENAQKFGRNDNILIAIKEYYELKFGKNQKVDIEFEYDKEKLYAKIKEIENNFYQEVKQYTYVTEDNKLKITNGSNGISIEYETLENELLSAIKNRDVPEFFEIPIYIEQAEEIDVEKIHSEVFVQVANAYYEKNPFKIYNEVKGVDFDKNILSEMISSNPENQEYVIDLQITEPEITVEGLGLYNDVLGECKTYYVNNPNRTTNLRLAANKINGKILMPGESFSYNEVVGERTVAAGYRNAAIYVNGEVEDGLAGGICQISSTLYDAVVYANLQVDERYNHARVPSYVTAGRDATVYWGSKDFKFTNNREYPIKISITVQGGYATAVIHGMKTENEYEISFESSVVSRYNGYMVVNTYKVYKQNGVEVKREFLSKDSYKV